MCVSAEHAGLWQLSSAPMCVERELVSQEREIGLDLASEQDVKHQRAELIESTSCHFVGNPGPNWKMQSFTKLNTPFNFGVF